MDIDPSFPEPAPIVSTPHLAWLSPEIEDDALWVRIGEVDVPSDLLRCESINGLPGPWIAVSGILQAEDQLLGRQVFGLFSTLVVQKKDARRLVQALEDGNVPLPWLSNNLPSDYKTFAGEIPWSQEFASHIEDRDPANLYLENINLPDGTSIQIEGLAHRYAWEPRNSLKDAEGAPVPSLMFSRKFDLRGFPQSFNQILPNGTPATITIGGIGGLEGDLLYLREDLLMDYVGKRQVVWLVWGERQVWPFPSSPPEELKKALEERANIWRIIRLCYQGGS